MKPKFFIALATAPMLPGVLGFTNTIDIMPRKTEKPYIKFAKPISKIIKSPFIAKKLKKLDHEAEKAKKIFRNISILKGKSMLIDTTKTKTFVSPYLGYLLYPQTGYCVRVERINGDYHINAGKNPWQRNKKIINIGKLMSKYGGGGHKTVGGVDKRTKSEILKIAEEIIEYLNKHG